MKWPDMVIDQTGGRRGAWIAIDGTRRYVRPTGEEASQPKGRGRDSRCLGDELN